MADNYITTNFVWLNYVNGNFHVIKYFVMFGDVAKFDYDYEDVVMHNVNNWLHIAVYSYPKGKITPPFSYKFGTLHASPFFNVLG
jgi:hypothetical protein